MPNYVLKRTVEEEFPVHLLVTGRTALRFGVRHSPSNRY